MQATDDITKTQQEQTIRLLHLLGISIHRLGYQCLRIAAPRFAERDTQSLSKELYPFVAEQLDIPDWRSVERAIRAVIVEAWARRDVSVWAQYFPDREKAPTNKQFLAVLAEKLQ